MQHKGTLKKKENNWIVVYEINDWTSRWFIGTGVRELPVSNESPEFKEGMSVTFTIQDDTAKIIQENDDNIHI